MYEPSTIQCRVYLDCKERVSMMQRDLCTLGSETINLCEQLDGIFRELETMHEDHRLKQKRKKFTFV